MPYTRTQWETSDNRSALAKLLESSPLKEALELLIYENLPAHQTNLPANDVGGRALLNDRREGFFDFYQQLVGLTKPALNKTGPEIQPWEHVLRKGKSSPRT